MLHLSWLDVELPDKPFGQFTAIQMFLIVALAEELWARLTLGHGATAVASPRTAWFWSMFWFLFMHVPTRLKYGFVAPVILTFLGIIVAVFLVFYKMNPNLFTAIVMHAVYNTLLVGLYYRTLIVDLVILALLVYITTRVTGTRIEIKVPEVVK